MILVINQHVSQGEEFVDDGLMPDIFNFCSLFYQSNLVSRYCIIALAKCTFILHEYVMESHSL
jgi:hypothetical protein